MLTITTGQFYTMGAVSLIILIAIVSVAIRLAETFLLRGIVLAVALVLLLGCWSQRGAITQSVRNCDPHVLFIHVKINDPRTMAACRKLNQSGLTGTSAGR